MIKNIKFTYNDMTTDTKESFIEYINGFIDSLLPFIKIFLI